MCVLVLDSQEVGSGHHGSDGSRPSGVKDQGNQGFREQGLRRNMPWRISRKQGLRAPLGAGARQSCQLWSRTETNIITLNHYL